MLGRIYLVTWRIYQILEIFCSALISGIFLGFFTDNQIYHLLELFYSENIKPTSPLLERSLFPWEKQAVDCFFQKQGHILVGAAGAGREWFALINMGFHVDAFECNSKLFLKLQEATRETIQNSVIYKSEYSTVPQIKKNYDSFIMGWAAYTHIPSKAQRIDFLKQVRGLLKPNAPILLSFHSRDELAFRYQIKNYLVYYIAAIIRFICLRKFIQLGDGLYGFFSHQFSKAEIIEEISSAGFELKYYANHKVYPHLVAVRQEA